MNQSNTLASDPSIKVDQGVLIRQRAKQADKYEKCFRKIYRYVKRVENDDRVGIPEMFGEIMDMLQEVYDP